MQARGRCRRELDDSHDDQTVSLACLATPVFQASLVMKYLARGVPAYFSPINRAKSSTELRGRWFTTIRWASPAALRVIVATAVVGSPWIRQVYSSMKPLSP